VSSLETKYTLRLGISCRQLSELGLPKLNWGMGLGSLSLGHMGTHRGNMGENLGGAEVGLSLQKPDNNNNSINL